MKFERYSGVNGNDDTYVRYVALGMFTPNEIQIYATKHGVTVDECTHTFRSAKDLGDFSNVLRVAFYHCTNLAKGREITDMFEPDCVAIAVETD